MATNNPELELAAQTLGAWLSSKLKASLNVAIYADEKNGRVCINLYPDGDLTPKRLAGQIKTNGATVFNSGKPINDKITGE